MELTRGGEIPEIYFGVDSNGDPKEVEEIYLGSELVYTRIVEPIEFVYTSAGTFTITIPFNNAELEAFLLGGGGGGDAGDGTWSYRYGKAGTRGSTDTTVLINLTKDLEITVEVGAGGAAGNGSANAPGGDGGATQLIVNEFAIASGDGGIGGGSTAQAGQFFSEAPASFGVVHQAVIDDSLGSSGAGGNGGTFGNYFPGKSGKNGYAWVRIRRVEP